MMKYISIAAVTLLMASASWAQGAPPPGECGGGFCGTPEQSGGGCGCGCGCSILIAFTDQGDTYQYADDFDDDGIEDDFDNCAFAFNPTQPDGDGDGSGDDCDNCPLAANAGLADVDADGLGDLCDDDADNDGVEALSLLDNCIFVPNPGLDNHDSDIFGDACDANDDDDNCLDALDNCPLESALNCDDDGVIRRNECFPDEDADGIDNSLDNCFAVTNLDQADADGDGAGDLCDPDLDQDQLANGFDNCPQLPNVDQGDLDHDGHGNACDPYLCFVITDEASCLDPAAPFAVHAGKTIATETGKEKLLHVFANRESRAIKYTWTVVSSPEDTDQYTIVNPTGSVSVSSTVEYIYEPEHEAKFTANVPGKYVLELQGELVHPEDDAYDVKVAKSQVEVTVGGTEIAGFGCSSTSPAAAAPAGLFLGLLALVRRRRR